MIQPYLDSVDTHGETGLIFIDGVFSHAIRKGALLTSGRAPSEELFAPEQISATRPSEAERSVAEATIQAMPGSLGVPVYARVDLLQTREGPVLLELEMAEPSIFMAHADGCGGDASRGGDPQTPGGVGGLGRQCGLLSPRARPPDRLRVGRRARCCRGRRGCAGAVTSV